jgi:hypothetical protein
MRSPTRVQIRVCKPDIYGVLGRFARRPFAPGIDRPELASLAAPTRGRTGNDDVAPPGTSPRGRTRRRG